MSSCSFLEVTTMALGFSMKSVQPASAVAPGKSLLPAQRVRAAKGICFGRNIVTLSSGSHVRVVSVRVAHIVRSDASHTTPNSRRGRRLNVNGQTKPGVQLLNDPRGYIASCDPPPSEVPSTSDPHKNDRHDHPADEWWSSLTTSRDSIVNENAELTGSCQLDRTKRLQANCAELDAETNNVGRFTGGIKESSGCRATQANLNGNASNKDGVGGDSLRYHRTVPEDGGIDQGASAKAPARACSPEGLTPDAAQDNAGQDARNVCVLETSNLRQGHSNGSERDGSIEAGYGTYHSENSNDDVDPDGYLEVGESDHEIRMESKLRSSLSEELSFRKAALLKSKLLQYFEDRTTETGEQRSISSPETIKFNATLEGQKSQSTLNTYNSFRHTRQSEAQSELERLKSLLNIRELEVADISRQLEEAKRILSVARAKATTELMNLTQLATEQNGRLNAAEQALSRIKKLHLGWWGAAGRVEVSGSFNGWQHNILLEPDPSSEIPKPDGTRGSMMWGTYLYLYSGVYEIKFIVDGSWQVDYRREVIMRDSIQNNILRVD